MTPDVSDAVDDVLVAAEDWLIGIIYQLSGGDPMTPDVSDAVDDVLVAAEDWLIGIILATYPKAALPKQANRAKLVAAIDELMSAIEFSERERPGRHMGGDGGENQGGKQ